MSTNYGLRRLAYIRASCSRIRDLIDGEAHGGIYALHSHLNHSCSPNVTARHFEGPAQPGKLTVVAKRAIAPGEELVVSYVDPGQNVRTRRARLRMWNFGECRCAKCVAEEKEMKPGAISEDDGLKVEKTDGEAGAGIDGLEQEIRDALGL